MKSDASVLAFMDQNMLRKWRDDMAITFLVQGECKCGPTSSMKRASGESMAMAEASTIIRCICVGNVCIYGFSPRVYTALDENRRNIEWESKGRNQTTLPMPLTRIIYLCAGRTRKFNKPISKVDHG
jgi:hypothetical protein